MEKLQRRLKYGFGQSAILTTDLFLLSAALFGAYWLRFESGLPVFRPTKPSSITPYWFAYFIGLYLIISQLLTFKLYSFDRFRQWHDEVYAIARAVSLAALLLLGLSFFYRGIDYSRLMVFMAWPLAIGTLSLGRSVIRGFLAVLRKKGWFVRRALILGTGGMLPIILEKMREKKGMGLEPYGLVDDKKPAEKDLLGLSYLGRAEDLEKVLKEHFIDLIIIVREEPDHLKLLGFIEKCEEKGVELLFVPQVFDLLIGFSGLRDLHGLPMVELREEPIDYGMFVLKRVADFFLSVLLLWLLLPVFLVIALAIRLDSKGPVFFSQQRVGYRGRRFKMWKFRTMISNAEAKLADLVDVEEMQEPVFKLENDPRITRLGRFLRRTSLDELPQLWNVLKGEMSLVGPRPEEVAMVERYNIWQRRRLKVKPGITGLQQIKCRGSQSLAERVKYDIYYIRRLGVLLDMEILVRTVWVVLSQRGAR